MFDAIVRDVRYAIRVLRKTPAFTVAAVLTLALAIGVNTAVFSFVNAVLLTPLPYPDPGKLALVAVMSDDGGTTRTGLAVDGRTWERIRDTVVSAKRAVFSTWTTGVNLVLRDSSGAERARYVQQQRVGAGFFDVLGVRPMLGRELNADEDRPQGPPAVVLSAELWRSALGADRSAIGRALMLRGETYTIVGVMPDGFYSGADADLWTALRPATSGEGGGTNYRILVRVADDASHDKTRAEIYAAGQELLRVAASRSTARIWMALAPLQSSMTEELRQPLLILWTAVAVVLLAASVNLAGLMLARTSGRAREIATRLALGSGRSVVLRQLLIEAIVLGIAGGVLGIGVAYLSIEGLAWLAEDTYAIWQPVRLDGIAIAAAATLAVGASLVFGLGPALTASRGRAAGPALTGSRSVTDSSKHWPRRALVVVQVALGVMLLVSAGLLFRTFNHLRTLDPGFDPYRLTIGAVSLEDARYGTALRVAQLAEGAAAKLQQTAGIESAALGLGLPYQRLLNLGFRRIDGAEAAMDTQRLSMTNATYVTSGFFDTMRIPLRRGRVIDARDVAASTPIVVVNEAFVRTYFKDTGLDRRIRVSGIDRHIVGVVGDVQVKPGWGNFGPLSAMPNAYLPITQVNDSFVRLVHTWFRPTFVVRSSLPPAHTTRAIQDAVASIDPLLPMASIESMSQVQAEALAPQRLLAILFVGLALAALGVAATGIHGLIATSVTERTREIGIRLALGSTMSQAMRALAMPGIVLGAIGAALGLVGAWSAAGLLRHFIWGVSASDPLTFGAVAVILMLTASVASIAPALRIVRLEPSRTLRSE